MPTSPDINECLEQTDTCVPDAQLCLNMHASFQCVDRVRETCVPGFMYDAQLKTCKGDMFWGWLIAYSVIDTLVTVCWAQK